MKKIFIIFSFLFCHSPEVFAHVVLGTTSWFSGQYEIISDIKVNDLQIRRVRWVDSNRCADQTEDDHIEMSGPINPDTPYLIEKLLKEIKSSENMCRFKDGKNKGKKYQVVEVFLNSGGGYMRDGYALGELFRNQYVKTIIMGECYSSCATAFLGGIRRNLNEKGKLMFHAPYYKTSNYDISCAREDNKLETYMKKMLNDIDGGFLYNRTMSYCSQSSGWSLNKDAARILGLLTSPTPE